MMIIFAIALGMMGLFLMMACSAKEPLLSPIKYMWKLVRALATNDKAPEYKDAIVELFCFYVLLAPFSGFAYLVLVVGGLMMAPPKHVEPFTCTNKDFIVIQQVNKPPVCVHPNYIELSKEKQ